MNTLRELSSDQKINALLDAAETLHDLVDDIDTASDMYKDNYEGYQKHVMELVKQRYKYSSPDGSFSILGVASAREELKTPYLIGERDVSNLDVRLIILAAVFAITAYLFIEINNYFGG